MTFPPRGGRGAIARNQYIRDKERVTSSKFTANICASRFLFTSHRLNVYVPCLGSASASRAMAPRCFGDARARNLTFRSSATARILRNYEAPRSNFRPHLSFPSSRAVFCALVAHHARPVDVTSRTG